MQVIPPDLLTVHHMDARNLDRLLSRFSSASDPALTCTITSPPYGNLKNYGADDQIGWGQPYDEYLVELRRVFRTIHKHTRDDGSMWLIVDTLRRDDSAVDKLPRLELLPFQLVQEAAESGWVLRETIIWEKGKSLPWSSGQRLRNAFEYVLLLVKSPSYKFHVERLRDYDEMSGWWVKWPERYNPHGKVPTNLWDVPIPVQGSWKAPAVQHACPLPPDLIERLLFLSTDEGDVVLDCFAGTGVVVAEAERLKRQGIGVELNKAYVKAFVKTLRPNIQRRDKNDEIARKAEDGLHKRDALIKLRALKFAKVLFQQLTNRHGDLPRPTVIGVVVDKFDEKALIEPTRLIKLRTVFAVEAEDYVREDVQRALTEINGRPPASKFGVTGTIEVVDPAKFAATLKRKRAHVYVGGRTWMSTGVRDLHRLDRVESRSVRSGDYDYPPIVSNLEVRETPPPER